MTMEWHFAVSLASAVDVRNVEISFDSFILVVFKSQTDQQIYFIATATLHLSLQRQCSVWDIESKTFYNKILLTEINIKIVTSETPKEINYRWRIT